MFFIAGVQMLRHIEWERVLVNHQSQVEAVAYLMKHHRLLTKAVPAPLRGVDPAWLARSEAFMLEELSPQERVTLYAYSSQDYEMIQDFIRGGTLYKAQYGKVPTPEMLSAQPISNWASIGYQVLVNARGRLGDAVRDTWRPRYDSAREDAAFRVVDAAFKQWLAEQPMGPLFYRAVHARMLDNMWEGACVFVHQSRVLTPINVPDAPTSILSARPTLGRFRALLPYLDHAGWRAMLQAFVRDMDAIFAKAPPLPRQMKVYRGVRDVKQASVGYVSTTLHKSVARDFINKETGCCVVSVNLEKGARVLPMWTLTRYWGEYEILLPRP